MEQIKFGITCIKSIKFPKLEGIKFSKKHKFALLSEQLQIEQNGTNFGSRTMTKVTNFPVM